MYLTSDYIQPLIIRRKPHPALETFIRYYEFQEHNNYLGAEWDKRLCFLPETSIDFFLTNCFQSNRINKNKLVLRNRAIVRTPLASKRCMPLVSGRFISFSIKFQPTGLYRLLGVRMDQLGNTSVPLHDLGCLPVEQVLEQMQGAGHINPCIRAIEPRLLQMTRFPNFYADNTEQAAQEIIRKNGLISIHALAAQSCLSLSQLEKNFNTKIGISPKQLASAHRLFALLREKSEHPENKWSALAYIYDYHDPIHFTRNFQQHFNFNPSDFNQGELILL